MKKSIAMKWAKALESGKYKQANGIYSDVGDDGERRYCCLAVLSHIRSKELKKKFDEHGDGGSLPTSVIKWSGCSKKNDGNPYITKYTQAITANDTNRWSFKKIAKAIRKNWKTI